MLGCIFRRYFREPLSYIIVLVFAAVLSVVLCHLEKSQEEELKSFRETYRTVPVHFTVTDLDGSQLKGSKSIQFWVVQLFLQDSKITPNFSDLVKDLKIRLEVTAILGEFQWSDQNEYYTKLNQATRTRLVGISSLRVAEKLAVGGVRWYEGYGEDILETDLPVCLVSEDYEGGDEITFSILYNDTATGEKRVYTSTLTVVGRFDGEKNAEIYCPYLVANETCNKAYRDKMFQCISATLTDNDRLDELRKTAAAWFAEPNPMGTPTPWGKFGYENYLYAMDIDDDLLQSLTETLENSMTVNRLGSALIFAMSALAGFLTGYLVIRSRKREIVLMRTVGCSNGGIYVQFALEQLICLALGVLLGGSYTLWQPLWKLAVFASVNFVGLNTALIVFLRANLLASIKEEE